MGIYYFETKLPVEMHKVIRMGLSRPGRQSFICSDFGFKFLSNTLWELAESPTEYVRKTLTGTTGFIAGSFLFQMNKKKKNLLCLIKSNSKGN